MTILPFKLYQINAIKSKIVVCLAFILIYQAGLAQSPKNTVVIPLKNGNNVSIQACTEQIYRIRISANTDLPETLMERYGILKIEWNTLKITFRKEKGSRIIEIAGFQFVINEATGNISVHDSNGFILSSGLYPSPNS